MTMAQFYDDRQIRPEWKAKETDDSYQYSVYMSEYDELFTAIVGLRQNGKQINQAGEDEAVSGKPLRMYAGLAPIGLREVDRLVYAYNMRDKSIQLLPSLVACFVDSLDGLLVEPDELRKGVPLTLVWKKKS